MFQYSEDESPNLVPVLDSATEIHTFAENDFILSHKTLKYQIKINLNTFNLISIIDGKKNLTEIVAHYNIKQPPNNQICIKDAFQLIYQSLCKYGFIVQNDVVVKKRERASYLKLSFILLKPKHLSWLLRILKPLYNPPIFHSIFIFSTISLIIFIILNYSLVFNQLKDLSVFEYICLYLLFGIALFFHELGHISACEYYGAKHEGIGFGFYLFSPVMFADVSDVWKLKRNQRIIVNLGGIYFGNIFSLLFIILYLIYPHIYLLFVPITLTIGSLINLNPLIKYDGYWILSDAINTPNLHKNSYLKLQHLIRTLKKRKLPLFKLKDYLLCLYGFISISFIFLFIASTLIITPDSILYFPINLFNLLKKVIFSSHSIKIEDFFNLIIPFLFYYLTIRLVITKIKKNKCYKKISS